LENFQPIRQLHNQIAAEYKTSAKYHFIGYLLHSEKIYELDGLKSGPSLIGFLEEGKDWISVASLRINDVIKVLLNNNYKFHLFALVADRKEILKDNLNKDKAIRSEIERRLGLNIEHKVNEEEKEKYKEVLAKLSEEKTTLQSMYNIVKVSIEKAEAEIDAEEKRRQEQDKEIRKKNYDYIPFLLSMLNTLGKHKHKKDLKP